MRAHFGNLTNPRRMGAFVVFALLTLGCRQFGIAPQASPVWPTYRPVSGDMPTAPSLRKGPYLLDPGRNTQMTVVWQLGERQTCELAWGLDPDCSLDAVSTVGGFDFLHKHTLTGLTPGTRYYYRVGVGSETWQGSFRTAPRADADAVRLLAYGDTRTHPEVHDKVCAGIVEAYRNDPEFQTILLHSGDWVGDGDSEDGWTNEFFNRTSRHALEMMANLPVQGCMGNHERSGLLFRKYRPYPVEAARYRSFDYGPAHIVIVDQYTDYTTGSAQLAWIERDLAASNKLWKIVCFHEPGYGGGGHPNNPQVQSLLQPLFRKHNVTLVLNGHNHHYAHCEVEGVHHVTTGGGGAPLYEPDLTLPHLVKAVAAHHFCKIAIEGGTLTFEAIRPDGSLLDRFVITQQTRTQRGGWLVF